MNDNQSCNKGTPPNVGIQILLRDVCIFVVVDF